LILLSFFQVEVKPEVSKGKARKRPRPPQNKSSAVWH
jgi:hypothetical protein